MTVAIYLDDSDSDEGPVTVLAGYYARKEDWEKFEHEAADLMFEEDVPILHAMKFHKTKGPFKGWSGQRKRAFVSKLYAITRRHIMGGQCSSLRKTDFKQFFKSDKLFAQHSPLGVCFSTLMTSWIMQHPNRDAIISEGISVFLEDGNHNNADIERIFAQLQGMELFGGALNDLTIVPKNSSRAIQLADFLAFHGRRNVSIWDAEGYRGEPFREDILRTISDALPTTFHRGRGKPIYMPDDVVEAMEKSHYSIGSNGIVAFFKPAKEES